MDEIMEKWKAMSDQEKINLMKKLMPSMCEVFARNPQKMMPAMMPMCAGMMKSSNMNMGQMMNVMMGGHKQET